MGPLVLAIFIFGNCESKDAPILRKSNGLFTSWNNSRVNVALKKEVIKTEGNGQKQEAINNHLPIGGNWSTNTFKRPRHGYLSTQGGMKKMETAQAREYGTKAVTNTTSSSSSYLGQTTPSSEVTPNHLVRSQGLWEISEVEKRTKPYQNVGVNNNEGYGDRTGRDKINRKSSSFGDDIIMTEPSNLYSSQSLHQNKKENIQNDSQTFENNNENELLNPLNTEMENTTTETNSSKGLINTENDELSRDIVGLVNITAENKTRSQDARNGQVIAMNNDNSSRIAPGNNSFNTDGLKINNKNISFQSYAGSIDDNGNTNNHSINGHNNRNIIRNNNTRNNHEDLMFTNSITTTNNISFNDNKNNNSSSNSNDTARDYLLINDGNRDPHILDTLSKKNDVVTKDIKHKTGIYDTNNRSAVSENGTGSRGLFEERRNVSDLLDNLMNGYDKRIRPGFGGGPVVVKADIEIRSMGPISEKDMIYSMDCYFRQVWADHRLSFNATLEQVNDVTLNVKMLDRIWKPDTIFGNGGHSYRHTITTPNMFFRLSDDGTILFSQRLTIKATCPMRLEKFPMDAQQCPLNIQSFGYPDADVHYEWRFGNDRAAKAATDMRLSQFDLKSMPACNMTRMFKGTAHSVLTVYFDFRRHTGYFLIQVYLPCCLLVVLSWVSFWINREATSERISLGATTMLTLTLIVLDTRNDLPKVTYPTALDMYVATCFSFIFASIVQFAAVHFHTKCGTADEDLPLKVDTDDEDGEDDVFLPSHDICMENQKKNRCSNAPFCLTKIWGCLMGTRKTENRFNKHVRTALGLNSVSKIDRMARIIFPAAFSGFNIVYWMAYL